jgi:hypothetical protein
MINSKLMAKFLDKAILKLSGEWIIIGGTVLPLVGIDHRVTVDIDIINLKMENSTKETIALMEIAESLKLPVESINQAGAYFLSKIDDVKDHLVLIKESKKCKIYRPDVYLFVKLKIERFSETDLDDCLIFIQKNGPEYLLHKKKIQAILNKKLKVSNDEQKKRLLKLLA